MLMAVKLFAVVRDETAHTMYFFSVIPDRQYMPVLYVPAGYDAERRRT